MEIVNIKDNEIVQSFNTNSRGIVTIGARKYTLPTNLDVEFWKTIKCYPVVQPFLEDGQHKSEIIWNSEKKTAKRIAINN